MTQSNSEKKTSEQKLKIGTKTKRKKAHNNHGGARVGSGSKKNPDAKYSDDRSKSIRLSRELANPKHRDAIESINTLLKKQNKTFFWLEETLKNKGIGGIYPVVKEKSFQNQADNLKFRKYNVPAAANFGVKQGEIPVSDSDAESGSFEEIDLIQLATGGRNLSAMFIVEANGESMMGAGIKSGDYLIIESIDYPMQKPTTGDIVLASVNGYVTVKKYVENHLKSYLVPQNETMEPVEITEEMNFDMYGIVRGIVRSFRRR